MNKRLISAIILSIILPGWLFTTTLSAAISEPMNSGSMIPAVVLSNKDYAAMLEAHGWPVDLLNTAAYAAYLSHDEKNLILAMNLIRYDPGKYADLYVADAITLFRGMNWRLPESGTVLVTHEGAAPARELYRELKRASRLDLFYPSEGLSRAANSHASWQSNNGRFGHDGQGGMQARIEREGVWSACISESIAYGIPSAHYAILALMIDDGVPDRGHRKGMLNPCLKTTGVAWATHPEYPGSGTYVAKFAGSFQEKSAHSSMRIRPIFACE